MSSSINKIHVNSSTKLSLNDRFTAIAIVQPKTSPRVRRPSVSGGRTAAQGAHTKATMANRRLLQQLAKKHQIAAAMKIKRRSLKPMTNSRRGTILPKRMSLRSMRLGLNGKLTKANSLTNIATMKADILSRPRQRSNSASNLAARLGNKRRRSVNGRNAIGAGTNNSGGGGLRLRRGGPSGAALTARNTRSNSRAANWPRSRSRSRSRSNIRKQNAPNAAIGGVRGGRSRSQSRARSVSRSRVPITSRLGFKNSPNNNNSNAAIGANRNNGRIRRFSQSGVQQGRITKRRNSTGVAAGNRGGVRAGVNGGNAAARARQGRLSQTRGRGNASKPAAVAVGRPRSQSRGRSRSVTRRGGATGGRRGGRQVQQQSQRGRKPQKQQQQQQRSRSINRAPSGSQQNNQRRGRSRSRGRANTNNRGGRGGAQTKPGVKKEDLDKELDQYMSTTKTDVDYLMG